MKICLFCHAHTLSGANMSMVDWLNDSKTSKNEYIVTIPKYNKKFVDSLYKAGVKKVIIGHYRTVNKKLFKLDKNNLIKYILEIIYAFVLNNFFYLLLAIKFKHENVDIIHSNSFATIGGAVISRIINVPHVWHVREFMEEDHQITHFFKKKVKKLTIKSHAIFISDVVKINYENKYRFLTEVVITNRITYSNEYKKDYKFLEKEPVNILFVGSLQVNKGAMDAIQCVELLNKKNIKIKLTICGVGVLYKELQNYCLKKHIDNIVFLGQRSDVIEIRKEMDIALVCSRMEALGRTSVEALYYENLLIGANAGCTPYIIENGVNGYLYESGNISQLALLIEDSISNVTKNRKIIEKAKISALEKFNHPIIHKIENLYDDISF